MFLKKHLIKQTLSVFAMILAVLLLTQGCRAKKHYEARYGVIRAELNLGKLIKT